MTSNDTRIFSDGPVAVEGENANFRHSDSQDVIDKTAPKEFEKTSGISKQEFYELAGRVSRSRVPDEKNLAHEGSSPGSSDRHSKKSRWRHNVNAYQASIGKNRKTCLRQLMLEWGKEGSNGLIFNIAPPRASANVEAPNYISWQYGPS